MQCIGHARDHALMYLSPQEIPNSSSDEQLRCYFSSATSGLSAPWILVINCAGARPSQLSAAKRVNTILRKDYGDKIRGTWLMNTSVIVRGVVSMFLSAADDESTITFLETDRLGLFVQLQRAGCSHTLVDWFIQQLA
jgi:hypothetical protein